MTYTRTLEFADGHGVEVTVTVRAPNERGSRVGAIESAMINSCYLYPLHERGDKTEARYGFMPYWACLLVGVLMPSTVVAMLFLMPRYAGAPPFDPSLKGFLLTTVLPFLCILCTSLFALVEWRARSFGAKVTSLRAARGAQATA